MNYLAHLHLADDHPDAVLGCLMGDFLKGAVSHELPQRLRHAVIQHRQIDSFTDAHAIVQRSKARISPAFRRYAGILIDMFYDHFLAVGWDKRCSMPLPKYAKRIYDIVDAHPHPLPGRMPMAMYYMIEHNSLTRYAEVDGIGGALRGIESRLKRPSRLGEAIAELDREYDALYSDFEAFFPALEHYVAQETQPAQTDIGQPG